MARGRRILDLRFDVLSEKSYMECPDSDRVKQGRRLLHCFDRYPRVFVGLTSQHLECVTVQGPRFSDVITACEKLIDLSLCPLQLWKGDCANDATRAAQRDKPRIWIQPETPTHLAPILRNLTFMDVNRIHPNSGIIWTLFLLEAAPLLKILSIMVTDHHCVPLEEELLERMFICEKNNINWEPSNFKHNNLTKLIIYGFRPENRFMSYIRRVMKAAVNLDEISLHDDRCEICESYYPITRYPHTKKERDLVKRAINEGRTSPIKSIHFFHTSEARTIKIID
uniref:FBD domain-containing protein n=1 Tax=Oryza glumipatula TaxID=40148 RepID=A0A0D9ZMB2_9ORYZ